MPVKQEWVEKIKEAISRAYREGRIENFIDFKKVFDGERDSLGIGNRRLKAAVWQSVWADSHVVVELRKKEKEVCRPITLNSLLKDLPLSTRTSNGLFRAGIKSVGDIVALLEEEGYDGLISIRNIGVLSAKEVYDALKWTGIEIPEIEIPEKKPEPDGEGAEAIKDQKSEVAKEKKEPTPRTRELRLHLETGETFTKVVSLDKMEDVAIAIGPLVSPSAPFVALIVRARKITIEMQG